MNEHHEIKTKEIREDIKCQPAIIINTFAYRTKNKLSFPQKSNFYDVHSSRMMTSITIEYLSIFKFQITKTGPHFQKFLTPH